MTLAAISHRGSYMEIGRAFEALFGQAMKQGLLTPTVHMIGVYHDDMKRRACAPTQGWS
jgi:AraC family transcriptional regulator